GDELLADLRQQAHRDELGGADAEPAEGEREEGEIAAGGAQRRHGLPRAEADRTRDAAPDQSRSARRPAGTARGGNGADGSRAGAGTSACPGPLCSRRPSRTMEATTTAPTWARGRENTQRTMGESCSTSTQAMTEHLRRGRTAG